VQTYDNESIFLILLLYSYYVLLLRIIICINIYVPFMSRAGFCGSAMVAEALMSSDTTSSVHTSQTECG